MLKSLKILSFGIIVSILLLLCYSVLHIVNADQHIFMQAFNGMMTIISSVTSYLTCQAFRNKSHIRFSSSVTFNTLIKMFGIILFFLVILINKIVPIGVKEVLIALLIYVLYSIMEIYLVFKMRSVKSQ